MLNSVNTEACFRSKLYFYLMKNRTTNIITVLIIAALCGLIALQIYFLRNAYQQEKQIFNNNVITALNKLSHSLEEQEAAAGIVDYVYDVRSFPPSDSAKHRVNRIIYAEENKRPLKTGVFKISKGKKGRWDTVISSKSGIRKNDTAHNPRIIISSGSDLKNDLHYRIKVDSNQIAFSYRFDEIIDTLKKMDSSRKKIVVSNVVNKMILADRIAIDNRIPERKLDSLLSKSLAKIGIDIPYKYSVYSGLGDSLAYIYGSSSLPSYRTISTKAELFTSDIMPFRNLLVVDFPSREMFLYKQIMTQIILSLLFVSLITFGFLYTIKTIHRQKRIAGHVVSFINNMTHEFKTPISTIAIAADAIGKPEILEDKSKVCRYNDVIKEENKRMRQQVEKILEMAVIEEGEYELKTEKLDMHELIDQAAASILVRIENENGRIDYDLCASDHFIKGDRLHILNILYNVLDNAVKYRKDNPAISISTINSNGKLHIIIEDNGIGIKSADIKRVFDKYYRVPTGNVHNVKGFGLGLSYVKLMVTAHRGNVDISSEPGRGTKVELIFPAAYE